MIRFIDENRHPFGVEFICFNTPEIVMQLQCHMNGSTAIQAGNLAWDFGFKLYGDGLKKGSYNLETWNIGPDVAYYQSHNFWNPGGYEVQ